MNSSEQSPPPAYFGSLTIENVKCFKGKHEIDLSDGNGKPAMWTVILGNNNTGKTTLLRCLADLESKSHTSTFGLDWIVPNFFKDPNKGLKYYNPEFRVEIHSKLIFKINNKNYLLDWFYYTENVDGAFRGSSSSKDSLSKQINILNNTENCNFFNENDDFLLIYGYGTSRKMGNTSLSDNESQDNTTSLFDDNVTLTNAEEWLLQTYFAEKLDKPNAAETLARIKEVLISGILPDVQDFRFDTTPDFKGFVEVKTDYGWVKLRELGYGYQVTLAWVVDLAKKLFERYPTSPNPLHEPAIVLVDEIDLHLHPEWQRKIIKFLSEQFPKTQFIATSHSPLIVQSADNINLVLLEKEDDHVIIKQRSDIKTFKGWTVEEILTELMGLGERTLSDDYLKFMHQFDEALDEDDYSKAKNAYDELDKILHPYSSQRKLLRIQMSGLIPA